MAMAFITDSPHQLPSCLMDAGRLTRPSSSCGDTRTLFKGRKSFAASVIQRCTVWPQGDKWYKGGQHLAPGTASLDKREAVMCGGDDNKQVLSGVALVRAA